MYRGSLRPVLPEHAVGRDLRVEGLVASIPSADSVAGGSSSWSTGFEAPAASVVGLPRTLRVRLDWYGASPRLVPGDRWRLTVRLKPPHGFINPGGFDYETWLFRERIRATGYVRADPDNARLESTPAYLVHRLRQRILLAVRQRLSAHEHQGLVPALSVGVRDGLTPSEWRVLRTTGTAHLVAISGLHIGLVAGLVFWLTRRLWMLSTRAALLCPAMRVGALTAMLAAFGYAALAGFSVPTQRALVMSAVVLLGLSLRRAVMPSMSLSWALFAVLLLDPLSVLSVGFWLSFGAVAALLYALSNRVECGGNRLTDTLRGWGRVQWAASLGLLPLMLFAFQAQPIVAPLANLLAVPWMSLVVVPLTLAGVVLSGFSDTLCTMVLDLALSAFDPLWHVLEWLGSRDWQYRVLGRITGWMLLGAVLGTLMLLAPRGFPGRWLGWVWVLPALLPGVEETPGHGAFRLSALDVGQGLALVVQTRTHVLVYDTGPSFGEHFDTGRAVVLPFLRAQGVGAVDVLVLSHADIDHSGGARSVLDDIAVGVLYAGEPQAWPDSVACRDGQGWHWDGVAFKFLHPGPGTMREGNNASCVLKVSGRGGTALLPGDIERRAELELVNQNRGGLQSEILVAAHHGSGTSSSSSLLAEVRPRYVVFSVGYRNRFGIPAFWGAGAYASLGCRAAVHVPGRSGGF